jgi:FkbM family methyltransferase
MDPLLLNKKIDLVDFEGLKLFMFRDDNLYNKFIPAHRKNQSADNYYKAVNEKKQYPVPSISYRTCESNTDPRSGLFIYFKHLLDQNIHFTVFDIGSHVGDFAIKCGHFFRDAGKNINVISFDPSPAGMLVPYNIEINGLSKYNRHEGFAVTEYDGYFVFNFTEGNSDSSKLSFSKEMKLSEKLKFYMGASLKFKIQTAFRLATAALRPKAKTYDIIVKGVNLQDYLTRNAIDQHLFLKVDVEGYDETLIRNIIPLKKDRCISFITELHVDFNSIAFLQEMSEHFHIFDLFYCPNPTRFKQIEPGDFKDFVNQDLKNRTYGYTDLFLLDKNTPNASELIKKLNTLTEKKGEMVL